MGHAGQSGGGAAGLIAGLLAAGASLATVAASVDDAPALQRCQLVGLARAARCGTLQRPLDPARPGGPHINLHFALVPAQARHAAADPVLFFAGGPGQSAIDLAGPLAARHARLNLRRDLVFVDQRGTGRSAPLVCDDDRPRAAWLPLASRASAVQRLARLAACRQTLQALPYGDLRFFSTEIASADVEAVRLRLGAPQINLIGVSYGSRAALDFLRQFPGSVRRLVLDGVVPPDMRLATAVARDNQAALDALFAACQADKACASRHPDLAAQWQRLLASMPAQVQLPHPVSGQLETVTLDADGLRALVRGPLYSPALAAGLPAALAEAAAGRFAPLAALGSALGGASHAVLASGMHYSVVCAEDLGGAAPPADPADRAALDDPANSFGHSFQRGYQQACADWPRAHISAGFHTVPSSAAPVWLLSGGLDPATPPRHGQRVAQALGAAAVHWVVPQAGHGVLGLPCLREAVHRFIDADDAQALAAAAPSADCLSALPRPPAFVPPGRPPKAQP